MDTTKKPEDFTLQEVAMEVHRLLSEAESRVRELRILSDAVEYLKATAT